MTKRYEFKSSARGVAKLDASVVGGELDRISAKNKGRVLPEHVVKSARPKRSPLHGYFEWDDRKAAEAHRLTQGGQLIRSVVVVYDYDGPEGEDSTAPVQAFVSVPTDEGRAYQDVQSVMCNVVQRSELLEEALRELEAWRRRYSHIKELADIFAALDSTAA